MKSHERANEKFKKAYRSAESILSKSVKRSENNLGERKVNIQNLTSEELFEYKQQLKKQRAAINKEERIRNREEHKKQIEGIILFVSITTIVGVSIFLYNTWKDKADAINDHSQEIISQYNYSQQDQEGGVGVDIVNWIDDLTENILNLNMNKGGK
jgi:hypothetical protein